VAPAVERMAEEMRDTVVFLKVDVDRVRDLAAMVRLFIFCYTHDWR
jgi:hypothetical protein